MNEVDESTPVPVNDDSLVASPGGPVLPWWSFLVLCAALVFLGFAAATFVGSNATATCEGGCPNASDVGFFRDMYDHHDQAVQIAASYQGNPDPEGYAALLADEILLGQRREQGIMIGWLESWGYALGEIDRTDAMAWMGSPTAVLDMPGMQDPAAISALDELPTDEATMQFYLMLRDHHVGGIEMALVAADKVDNAFVRRYATDWAEVQTFEIFEVDAQLTLLGVDTSTLPQPEVVEGPDGLMHSHD